MCNGATLASDVSNGLLLELNVSGVRRLQPTWSSNGAYMAVADVRLPLSGAMTNAGGGGCGAAGGPTRRPSAHMVFLSAAEGADLPRLRVAAVLFLQAVDRRVAEDAPLP